MRILASKRRRRVWTRVGATVGALALLTVAGSAASEPDATYPNAPDFGDGPVTAYDSTTLTYAAKSKQWIRIPHVKLAAWVFAETVRPGGVPAACTERFGDECNPAAHADTRVFSDALSYPVATLPADPTNAHFDAFPDVTVRTVAFGSIPVNATLSLTLPTDADGFPIGLHATTFWDAYPGGAGDPPPEISDPSRRWLRIADTPVGGAVWVRVKALSVDGVPITVGNHCRTAQPAKLDLVGRGYDTYEDEGNHLKPGGFTALLGGTLRGTIDVPRFAGCGSGSENLSALVTSVASGDGFPVEAQTGSPDAVDCWGFNPDTIDWRMCPTAPDLPLPTSAP